MLNDVVAGITKALKQVRDIPVYSNEEVRQGIECPCFFIDFIGLTETPRLYPRFHRDQPFDIHYFSEEAGNRAEIYEMAEAMYPVLDFIEGLSGDKYHGTRMRHEIIDGVLHFFVNYNVHVYRPVTKETRMEEIKYEPKSEGR